MQFTLPPLPYAKDGLEPYLGAETLEYHYEKHHRGYLKKLESLIEGTPLASKPLEEIIGTADGPVFNNAAQVWNHTFYWRSMRPGGGGDPRGALRSDLERAFGSMNGFRKHFVETATAVFGTGYVWLHDGADGRLVVRGMEDADNPLIDGIVPLLGIDLWEHAYYLDYRNERERYVATFLDHLVDWDMVAEGRERLRRSA